MPNLCENGLELSLIVNKRNLFSVKCIRWKTTSRYPQFFKLVRINLRNYILSCTSYYY